ncbi:MAG: SpoIIE family protein phosphatase [Acidobacteriota bacterium]
MPTLQVETADGPSQPVRLEVAEFTIGRATESALAIPSLALSRHHARIVRRDGGYVLEDRGSRNGTYLNGVAIAEPMPLADGDEIRLGDVRIVFRADTAAVAIGGPQKPVSGSETFFLRRDQLDFRRYAEESRSGVVATEAGIWPTLSDAAATLITHYPVDQLLDVVMDIVLRAVPAQRGALLLRSEGGELETRVLRTPPGQQELRISRTILQQVIDEQKAVLTVDAQLDERFGLAQSIRMQGIRSILCVPLWAERDVIGLIYVDNQIADHAFSQTDLKLLGLIANMAAVKVENCRLLAEQIEKERMEEQLQVAAEIQRRLLPQSNPEVASYAVRGFTRPCYEIGGDYYDFLWRGSRRLGLIIADVSGKGVGAALLMAAFQASLRTLVRGDLQAAPLIDRLNGVLKENSPASKFVTAFYGELDLDSHELLYVNAGHNPPYLVRGGAVEALPATGPVVGLLPGVSFRTGSVRLSPGDLLALYTDGVTECESVTEEEFGDQRLQSFLVTHAGDDLDELARTLFEELGAFSRGAPRKDDTTVLLARRLA